MPALQQLDPITLKQYEELPEDQRAEVFEGIVYDMASPSQEHQTISMELSTLINTYIKERNGSCRVFHAPFDVKLSDKPLTIVQPDIMVICVFAYTFFAFIQFLSLFNKRLHRPRPLFFSRIYPEKRHMKWHVDQKTVDSTFCKLILLPLKAC